MAERIVSIVERDCLAVFRARSFRDHDGRIARSLRSSGNQSRWANSIVENLKHSFVAEWMFRNQDDVRLAGDAGPQGEMPRVSSHHFDDLHPTVRPGGRARAFEDLSDVAHRRVEAQRVIRAREILVDRLWNADYLQAFFRQLRGDSERVFAAAYYDCLQSNLLDVGQDFVGSILMLACFIDLAKGISAR